VATTDVLRQFLVRLGFEVDESGMKKLTAGVEGTTAAVLRLGKQIGLTAVSVGAGVAIFAARMRDLYFEAQRTGASVTNIGAFRFAVEQMGGSAGQASAALESLGSFIRFMPGAAQVIRSFGVEALDPVTGKFRDTTAILTDLGDAFAGMDPVVARARAQVLGIDQDMLLVLERGGLRKYLDEYRAMAAKSGLTPEQMARDATAFTQKLGEMRAQFTLLGMNIESAIVRRAGPDLDRFKQWVSDNAPRISNAIARVVELLLSFAERVVPALMSFIETLSDLDRATGGLSTTVIGLAVAFKLLGGPALLSGVVAVLTRIGAALGATTAEAGALTLALRGLGLLGAAGVAGAVGWGIGTLANKGINAAGEAITGQEGWTLGGQIYDWTHGDESAQRERQGRQQFALSKLQSMGWSAAQAAGIAANLMRESAFSPTAVGDSGQAYGIAQWHSDRQREFERWAGFSIRDPRATLSKQLEFVNYELTRGRESGAGAALRASTNAGQAAEVVSRMYERPAASALEAARRARMAMNIQQTTTIHVDGARDPDLVGQAVAGQQARVNDSMAAALARNLPTRAY
jgi:hypothetical protein